jgi:hypothetical protein
MPEHATHDQASGSRHTNGFPRTCLKQLPVTFTAKVRHCITRPLGARVQCAPAQALHHPQITAAVHAETGRPWVGQILAGSRSHGDGLGVGLGHVYLSL